MARPPALLDLIVNGVLSASSLGFIYVYGWSGTPGIVEASSPLAAKADPTPSSPKKVAPEDSLAGRCTRVLLAGFAAMAFFRSA